MLLATFKDCDMTITIETGLPSQSVYIIPLVRLTTAQELIDWIYQIKSKSWARHEHIVDFLSAVDIACQYAFDMPAQIAFKDEPLEWTL